MVLQNSGKYKKVKGNSSKESIAYSGREETSEYRLRRLLENEAIDTKYGFDKVADNIERTGFLLNMHSTEVLNEDKRLVSALDFYFIQEDGSRFKVSYVFMPYFFIITKSELINETCQFLCKKYAGTIVNCEVIDKEDLDLPNHLVGLKQKYIKLSFSNQSDLITLRKDILKVVRKNRGKVDENSYYTEMLTETLVGAQAETSKSRSAAMENITDIREYDVPYHVRVSIDLKIFCGSWYSVKCKGNSLEPPLITPRKDILERPEPIVLAYDIETTKLPLKFPDPNTDQIMMISYMIDAQGYLITNREILSADIEDFEYTPKPEYEGKFKVFNEPNEKQLIMRFFQHILDVRPHIFVTYNGDFFDWPFLEARAAAYDLVMRNEIGFGKTGDNYLSRPAVHMDCFCWVKRDSYLPVGSHNLKAVAKAKLRYDPVELDPEEMCPLATSAPQVLSNYSVSDAVATYYLYMQYVHPFIFALCTIIPCEPDEVLRKGSGTLCEELLMVEAFHANIIFPNKEETVLNKLTEDGHVLHQETYVGGHVEALECGVFRADIPCRFKLALDTIDELIENLPNTLRHAIEVEEGVPMDKVLNVDEIQEEITTKLLALKEQPMRLEKPLIYHLDVGAMYPNIILTNRLQPCAMVNETICASCDFNSANAKCQRNMAWMSREEFMPATRNEYQRIQQQLETERFPPLNKDGPRRAFHQLSKQEQAELEKQRLSVYCRIVYKKQRVIRVEEKTTTICQKENSFYVDTVRAFRDRRYEYKALSKKAKAAVTSAIKSGNASEIKSAKNREVLYDSLQLAHKCILNSFYGYVMRRGARWFSMEMAGIVCHTGAHIIMKAREIIEKVGRPLELDTDGIWCILPASFPENVVIHTSDEKKKKLIISYPNAVLNSMVKEYFTNDQYHELVNSETHEYKIRDENSIFFEVDGPYKAMVLPASKEEGKKLKKRYAVFNFDGSLAELKGFEIKRRGELQIIKNFQSSVFEAFLKGETLETCYGAVAQVADYWLDVLFSHGVNIPDNELFELISENKSMSKKLEEYGEQKSTSISTAKKLAEFLGDQMVKDAGLNCRYVIAKKPNGAPVTERAIPLAIFQAEPNIRNHYIRKWLKDNTLDEIDIRDILDWDYYIERLSGTIQKIITIPAAMQGISNPVSRVQHPSWLHKKILEKNDTLKQRKINELFKKKEVDLEDFGKDVFTKPTVAVVNKRKREEEYDAEDMNKTWKDVLGNPPAIGNTFEEITDWIKFQKKKWAFQSLQRQSGNDKNKKIRGDSSNVVRSGGILKGFIQKAQKSLQFCVWQIIQVVETNTPGEFKLWALVQSELHLLKIRVPKIYYVNLKTPKAADEGDLFKKCKRILPRSRSVYNLYMYKVPEELYRKFEKNVLLDSTDPSVEGIYETQVSSTFRIFMEIGAVCRLKRGTPIKDVYDFDNFEMASISKDSYLPSNSLKHIYFYQHKHATKNQQMFGLFMSPIRKVLIIVVDTVRTNLMPNVTHLYQSEMNYKKEKNVEDLLPPENMSFEIRVETNMSVVYKFLQKALISYKEEKKGPTLLAVQSTTTINGLASNIPLLSDFPLMQIHIQDLDDLYNVLEWQKVGAKAMIRNYLNSERVIELMKEQSRYFHLPIGNMPSDPAIFGSDLFYARHLKRNNHLLWYSTSDKPDLGGTQENNARLLAENQEGASEFCNKPGWYASMCLELDIDSLAINTLLQAHHVTDIEGVSSVNAFHSAAITTVEDLVEGNQTSYDETGTCAEAFKILRGMASTWMRDISVYRNIYADFQVIHFYRWLRSPNALLYDPALLKTLQNLMKKLFLQLVAEFKRLRCNVVYANFNKIVICTRKKNVEDAVSNVEFIIASIRNKELFHSLEITLRQCWELLVWLDTANFAGIQQKLPENHQNNENLEEQVENEEDDDDDSSPTVMMNWNIAEQLPERGGCRKSFNTVIASYIDAIYHRLHSSESSNSETVSNEISNGLMAFPEVASYASELISGEISQTLFKIIEKINRIILEEGTSPALEYIKAICHIFELDPTIKDAVLNLKSNLLRLIGVNEFSQKAVWIDPTVSYVIPQIICKACNHCRDLDLGRDPFRTEHAWLCPLCKTQYDNCDLENILLDIIARKFLAYNLQDLQCKKCHQIKREDLIVKCSCASDFQCLMSREDLLKLFETFKSLSETFNMPTLRELMEQTLKLT